MSLAKHDPQAPAPVRRGHGLKPIDHLRTPGTGAEAVHLTRAAGDWVELGRYEVFWSPVGVDSRRTAGVNLVKPRRTGWLARFMVPAGLAHGHRIPDFPPHERI